MKTPNYLPFERLAEKVGVVGLDIGTRGGVSADLQGIGNSIDFYGLEPDARQRSQALTWLRRKVKRILG